MALSRGWPLRTIMSSGNIMLSWVILSPILVDYKGLMIASTVCVLYLPLRRAGLWIFCLGFWGAGGTSSWGQQIAFFLLLVVLALVFSPTLREKDSPKLALLSTVGLLAIAIVPSHLLTSLVLVLMLAAFSVVRRTSSSRSATGMAEPPLSV